VPAAPVAQRPAPAPVRAPADAGAGLFGAGDTQPDYLLLLDPPTEDEERQGQPVLGDAGKLLDNMLAALGVSRKRSVYLACVPRSGLEGLDELLRQQVEQLRPRVILAMGRFAVQGLLRNQADKANAWADLCLARSLLE
jgi:DNA polymerase